MLRWFWFQISTNLTASANLIGWAAHIVRAKLLTAFAIAVFAIAAFGWTAADAAGREAEARRLFVEAAKIARSGPCKEHSAFLTGSVGWALLVISISLGSDDAVPCLSHYRKAARIYDRLLNEYPETEAAFRTAGDGYPSEAAVDKILADIKKRKAAADKVLISKIQERLSTLGYYLGSRDGIFGPETRSAIREYQHRKGLAVDGKPSEGLLSRLRTSALELSSESERRKPGATKIKPQQKPVSVEDFIRDTIRGVTKGRPKSSPPEPPKASTGQRLTISELDSIRRQIEACWSIPAGARDAENLIVDISVIMNPDGTVQRAEIVDRSRLTGDPFYRAAAESALRAVLHPRCSPLRLPPQKYRQWRRFTLSFNPKELIGS